MTALIVVEQFLDAFARHDLEGMIALLAADAYFVPTGHEFAPAYGDFSGHDGWREWWATVGGERLSLERLEVEQLDEHRVVAELLIGAATDDGWEGAVRVCVYTVRADKLVAVEVFTNRDRANDRIRAHSKAPPPG